MRFSFGLALLLVSSPLIGCLAAGASGTPADSGGTEAIHGGCLAGGAGAGDDDDEAALLMVGAQKHFREVAEAEAEVNDFQLADEEKLVEHLPGLGPWGRLHFTKTRMATGYLTVSAPGEPVRKLFYWFVQSKGNPRADPLVLWTNGGPGCSGLSGFLAEMGPFRPTSTGDLSVNPHAWTNFANMIFIEQPAGVGFSTIEQQEGFVYTDENSAADMWTFIKEFVAQHPEYKTRPFYLTAESYGGHYLPATALHVVKNNKGEVNFKGFAVGNPLTDEVYTNYGMFSKWYNFGLLSKPKFDKFMQNGCYKLGTAQQGDVAMDVLENCENQEEEWFSELFPGVEKISNASEPGFDPYALSFNVCSGKELVKFELKWLKFGRNFASRMLARYTYQPCMGNPINHNFVTGYLNRADVQKAIHVIGNPTWEECSDPVGEQYSDQSVTSSMVPVYRELVANGTLNIMIYSGTDDSICPLQGLQQWIWDQGYNVTEDWVPYAVDGQSGGFTSRFTAANGAGYRVTTVNGAGHMVPSTQPERGVYIMKQFLSGEWS